ncbi:unnamed protein product, partial [Ranitomeya imitator]
TGAFLNVIKSIKDVTGDTILVTLDVNNLYTSIKHEKGMQATRLLLEGTNMEPRAINFLMNLLNLVLTENFFLFEDTYFLQVQGTAMGSNVAPPYANAFMSFFESEFVYTNILYKTHCHTWLRYIDDIFCMWVGPLTTLEEFFNQINAIWPELTFTITHDYNQVNFLDTTIIKESDGTLSTDLYTKSTDRNSLLLYQSCHPLATKKSIPISQFHRVRKIVSNDNTCKIRLDEMETRFTQRGYPKRLLYDCRQRLGSSDDKVFTHRIPFVHTFHPFAYKLHRKIRKHWSLLQTSYPDIPEFRTPFLPCFRKPSNLRNKLVRADMGSIQRVPRQVFLQTQRKGTFTCLKCSQCANVLKGPRISHPLTGTDIPIRGFFTCDSQYVVYAIKCPCGQIYVGETTQAVKDRISQHKSDIRCGKTHLPVPNHFHQAGHTIAQLRFLVLEQIFSNRRGGNRVKRLKLREAFWIHYLQSMEPKGLNRDLHNYTTDHLISRDNTDFCQRFEQILNKCSLDLMTLTLDYLHKEVKTSQDKLQSIETQLKDTSSKEEFESIKSRMKDNLEVYRLETEKRKRQKFIRDTQDYLQNRVYRWRGSTTSYRYNYRGSRFTGGSSTSSSDNERTDIQRAPFLGTDRRFNRRKGRGGVASAAETNRHTMNTRSQLDLDLQRFYRNIRLKAFFHNQIPSNIIARDTIENAPINLPSLGLRLPSHFNPPKNYPPVETFIALIEREVDRFSKQITKGELVFQKNLDHSEHMALQSLMSDKDIVIKPADKGGATVVMDRSMYREEILAQLNNRTVYLPLSHNPSSTIESKIRGLLEEALHLGIIDKKTQEFLTKTNPMIPVFYTLPKIHKRLDRPPGRPIVASTNSILSPLYRSLLECHKKYQGRYRDTILVTLDVNNLYTSIKHEKGMQATRLLLEGTNMEPRAINFLMNLLNLVLTENFFLFEDTYFLQVQGTAMGSNVAPPPTLMRLCPSLNLNSCILIYCIRHIVTRG